MPHVLRTTWAADAPAALRKALTRALDARLDSAEQTFRTHKRSTVCRMLIDGTDLVLKRFNAPDVPTRLRRLISPSPARRAWRNAFLLQRLGIATPRPLACIQTLTERLQPVSYLAVEHVPGLSAEAFFLDPDSPRDLKQTVAARIVESVARLHGAGYIHGDLKGRNILIHDATPYFIDLDSVRRRVLPPNRRRGTSKDLARLYATVPAIRDQVDFPEDRAAC